MKTSVYITIAAIIVFAFLFIFPKIKLKELDTKFDTIKLNNQTNITKKTNIIYKDSTIIINKVITKIKYNNENITKMLIDTISINDDSITNIITTQLTYCKSRLHLLH